MRPIRDLMASLVGLTDESVRRIRKTAEDPPRVSVFDVVCVVTGLELSNAHNVWERLKNQFPEVSTHCSNFKFPGRGQRETPITCVKGAVLIVMLLPGRAAASVRKGAASTLVRYLGGDLSMVQEIAQNHLAQQEMDEDDPARLFGQHVESDRVKRAREDLTIAELEGALKRRRVESIQFCMQALEDSGMSDDRDRMRCTDMIRSVAFGESPAASTEAPAGDTEICIRAVVNAAGRARESPQIDMKLGKLAKKLYLADHPEFTFPKKKIWANGQQILANSWVESQRPYIERALAAL